ncbi:DUF4439 domain-containing protein [Nocardioides mangrovi]|uniref:Ferritin-like domain-containing protein n=1 Tax=Nocardioides mangrovi TaxID=2874580 RepID=A0ABS7U7Z9_9ACTN|nr:DUF4439 domain-containing protein [Nocardioides mangrovi]MBZ5736970.1 ferritin-like domain-containing protein [Nocardioides mangrovi]
MSDVDALQTALAAEHAAVWVFGALGGRTSASATPDLFGSVSASYDDHLDRRDDLSDAIVEAGGTPVAAEPAYELPTLDTPAQVEAVALRTERSCATTYAWLTGRTSGAWRRWAIEALNRTAVRELAFRGTPEMFPGSDEYADR